ncbi:hypothetical protein D3746_16465 [Vibrio parahaemolyticus]|nr:hypothetical protein [Vibrio parahaemolyticus]
MSMCFWLGSRISISSCLSLRKSCFFFLVRCEFSVSDADELVESLLCCIVVPKGLFGVQSPFSTAL